MEPANTTHNELYGNYKNFYNVLTAKPAKNIIINPPETPGSVKFVNKHFSFNIPKTHPLANLISNKPNVIYEGDQYPFDLVYIILDKDSKYHDRFFTLHSNTRTFLKRVFQYLPDIVKLANIYNIKPVYDYIEDIFKLYGNGHSIHHEVDNFCRENNKNVDVLKTIMTEFKELTGIKFDVDVECKRHISFSAYYLSDLIYHSRPSSTTVFKGCKPVIEYLIAKAARKKFNEEKKHVIYPIQPVYIIQRFVKGEKITMLSEFILIKSNGGSIDTKNIKPSLPGYESYYEMDLPSHIKSSIIFNLMLLSAAPHYIDMIGDYITNDE